MRPYDARVTYPPPTNHQSGALAHLYEQAIREDFRYFLRHSFHVLNPSQPFVPNWHLDAIIEYLNALEACELQRLIINMPPRSLKSLSITVAWSAYLLARKPATRIITASYASGISLKHATDVRALIGNHWFMRAFPDCQILAGQNEKHKFMTTQHGFRLATSVGGTLTGEGGDVIIMDDPLNPAQASSRTMREQANHWFDNTLSTRLNNKRTGRMVLVMQRLHKDDVSGHLLERGGWEHLCLPAQAPRELLIEMGDFRHVMREGELLQPMRETEEVLAQLRIDLGSYAYQAQYLQDPVAESGNLIERSWLRETTIKSREAYELVIQSWDTAIKTGAQHDFTVCATLGKHDAGYDIMDIERTKLDYPDLKRIIIARANTCAPDAILIEDKASGQSLLQDLRKETTLPLIGVMPKGDKFHRAARITPLLEAGQVSLPAHAVWRDAFMVELVQFPHASHDDQVDAFTQGLNWLAKQTHKHDKIRKL